MRIALAAVAILFGRDAHSYAWAAFMMMWKLIDVVRALEEE